MNKEKKMLSHLRQKERKRLKWNRSYLDSYHYPKDEMYKQMTECSCFNCESMYLEDCKVMCETFEDIVPFLMGCPHFSSCGKDRLRTPLKIVDWEG